MGCDIHIYVETRSWPADPDRAAFLRGLARGDPAARRGPASYADWLDERGLSVPCPECRGNGVKLVGVLGAANACRTCRTRGVLDVRTLDAAAVLRAEVPWVYRPEADEHAAYERAVGPFPSTKQGKDYLDAIAAEPLYVGRNYALFERLAGVRGSVRNAVAPPRGLPSDASPEVFREFTMRVVTPDPTADPDSRGCCTLSDAGRWVANGSSVWVVPGEVVTHPDWHTPSWYLVSELSAAPDRARAGGAKFWEKTLPAYGALAPGGAEDVRLVFWFDN